MAKRVRIFFFYCFISSIFSWCGAPLFGQKKADFSRSNLVAWCVVPFDAEKRGPMERAKMLSELGITKLAYDWREEHIPQFDEELKALTTYRITLEAFWMMSGKNAAENSGVKAVLDFVERNQVKTQLWLMMVEWNGFEQLSQSEKVSQMGEEIRYIARKAGELGCQVGLYNHGGWFGEPENQLAIIEHLDMRNVGMVYNFHHARKHHQRFSSFYPKIEPHLLCLNIAGLKEGDTQRFYRTGQGGVEKNMIRQVWKSGYKGPIGIINHNEAVDAKKGLTEEMEGLKVILYELGDKKALRSYQ
jgi:hydroxypyruvate isomerase